MYGEKSGLHRLAVVPDDGPRVETIRLDVEIRTDATGSLCRWGTGPKGRCPLLQSELDRCSLFGGLKTRHMDDRGVLYYERHDRCRKAKQA
jgi:hypothetical protein